MNMVAAIGGAKSFELNILGHARLLFREAVAAFDAGAYAATGLVCRASLEAACLGFLCREWNKDGYWGLKLPRTLDGRIRIVTFEELIAGVENAKVLSRKKLNDIRMVQRDGNLIAHFVSGREKGVMRILSPSDHGVVVGERVKLWLGRGDALEDLKTTSSILAALGARMLAESK